MNKLFKVLGVAMTVITLIGEIANLSSDDD